MDKHIAAFIVAHELPSLCLQVEAMVRMKMEQKEYIILCLEDSNDWSNATTRRLVMQARAGAAGAGHWSAVLSSEVLDGCMGVACANANALAPLNMRPHCRWTPRCLAPWWSPPSWTRASRR